MTKICVKFFLQFLYVSLEHHASLGWLFEINMLCKKMKLFTPWSSLIIPMDTYNFKYILITILYILKLDVLVNEIMNILKLII